MTPSRRHSRGADDIGLSNSTASLFMGAARKNKNWMLARSSLPTCSLHAMRPPAATPDIPLALPVSAPLPDSTSALELNKHAHPQPPAIDAAGPLMSPVTPGANLPAPLQIASHQQPQLQPQSDIPPPSLPSPVLSASSLSTTDIPPPRPPGATLSDNNQKENGTSRPDQLDLTPPTQLSPIATSTPANANENANLQSDTHSPRGPWQEPVVSSHQPHTAPVLTQVNNTGDLNWLGWEPELKVLLEVGQRSTSSVNSRTILLQKAFLYRDHFYLVLHQVHCRWTASGYQDFPEFQPAMRQGFRKLNELLKDNALIPHDVMSRFVAFPRKYEDLKDADWYRLDFKLLTIVLPRLSNYFIYLADRISQGFYHHRRYPPLMVEMRKELQVTSPVLLAVIFTSTCRHLYQDTFLPVLHTYFEKDMAMTYADSEKFRNDLIQKFQRIPMKPFDTAPHFQLAPLARPQSTVPCQPAATVTSTSSPVCLRVLSRRQSQLRGLRIHRHMCQTLWGDPRMLQAPSGHMQQPTQMQRPGPIYYWNGQPQPPSVQQPANMPTLAHHVPQNVNQLHNEQNRQNHLFQMVQVSQAHQAVQGPTQQLATFPNMSYPQQGVTYAPFHVSQLQAQSTAQNQHQLQINSSNLQQMNSIGHPQLPSSIQQHHGGPSPSQIRHSQPVRQQRVASVPTITTPTVSFVSPRSAQSPPNSLLPALGYRMPQLVQPNPMRLSLHQVDLLDPIKKLVHLESNVMDGKELYLFMNGFAMPPKFMGLEEISCNWTFQVSALDMKRATRLVEGKPGKRPTVWYQEGCLSLRLRAIALGSLDKDKVYDTWPTANTVWPSVFYIHINGTELFVRRKNHNGKDSPLDITPHIKEGENTLSLHFLLEPGECKKHRYVFGIERMDTLGFDQVRQQASISPANDTLQIIQKRLCPTTDNDELAVVSDSLTVGLIDPFMAQVYNVPARSVHCDHLECFDLDVFINTRKSESGLGPMNDNWQCPICKADARPMHLIIDEYFVNVREKLISTHKLEGTVAIDVRADGSWATKVAIDEHSDKHASGTQSVKRKATSPLDREASRAKQEPSPPITNTEHTVIEID
ncbi:hypothetical protein N7533_007412 [Penicillium manginii]|uniref:uncharacterized protein n=1 Tax=Penicillium manginii TaxID=203109 RepID=UPI002547D522|nr:uncharacterized protein N7533_007412 [Penicillium manginii]KAJ5750384.1 hypothetical protein N7533_007412 [Penicillium manginii]